MIHWRFVVSKYSCVEVFIQFIITLFKQTKEFRWYILRIVNSHNSWLIIYQFPRFTLHCFHCETVFHFLTDWMFCFQVNIFRISSTLEKVEFENSGPLAPLTMSSTTLVHKFRSFLVFRYRKKTDNMKLLLSADLNQTLFGRESESDKIEVVLSVYFLNCGFW